MNGDVGMHHAHGNIFGGGIIIPLSACRPGP